jgi:hypothetical protein
MAGKLQIKGNLFSPGGDIGGGSTINGVPIVDIGTLPLVNGDTPGPVFITDDKGQCVGCPLA